MFNVSVPSCDSEALLDSFGKSHFPSFRTIPWPLSKTGKRPLQLRKSLRFLRHGRVFPRNELISLSGTKPDLGLKTHFSKLEEISVSSGRKVGRESGYLSNKPGARTIFVSKFHRPSKLRRLPFKSWPKRFSHDSEPRTLARLEINFHRVSVWVCTYGETKGNVEKTGDSRSVRRFEIPPKFLIHGRIEK